MEFVLSEDIVFSVVLVEDAVLSEDAALAEDSVLVVDAVVPADDVLSEALLPRDVLVVKEPASNLISFLALTAPSGGTCGTEICVRERGVCGERKRLTAAASRRERRGDPGKGVGVAGSSRAATKDRRQRG